MSLVKYLYCPNCKELRVKPWYARTERCSICHGPVKGMPVQTTVLTYAKYILMILVFALVILQLNTGRQIYLNLAIVFLVATMIVSYIELSRAERLVKSKIKVTKADMKNPKVRRKFQR